MAKSKTLRKDDCMRQIFDHSKRIKIPAREVGVTLKVSDEAIAELDRIAEENAKAAQDAGKYLWR